MGPMVECKNEDASMRGLVLSLCIDEIRHFASMRKVPNGAFEQYTKVANLQEFTLLTPQTK